MDEMWWVIASEQTQSPLCREYCTPLVHIQPCNIMSSVRPCCCDSDLPFRPAGHLGQLPYYRAETEDTVSMTVSVFAYIRVTGTQKSMCVEVVVFVFVSLFAFGTFSLSILAQLFPMSLFQSTTQTLHCLHTNMLHQIWRWWQKNQLCCKSM